jgi:serine/threonine protein kinase
MLQRAHHVYKDIKPENTLFDYNYTPRLADMGFSKVFRQNNQRIKLHEQLGSRGYHAPEIVREKYYSENVDVFSLGVVLFIMYAGSPPFRQVKK